MSDTIHIENDVACATSECGPRAHTPVRRLVEQIRGPRNPAADFVFPDGVKYVLARYPLLAVGLELPAQVRACRWISRDSPVRCGRGTLYRQVRLSMPNTLIASLFAIRPGVGLRLAKRNEAFFMNRPLKSLDDPVCFPALLNVSRYKDRDAQNPTPHIMKGRNLSWLCTQRMNLGEFDEVADINLRIRRSLVALVAHLFDGGFNYSSEEFPDPTEECSYYTHSIAASPDLRRHLDPVERWEALTARDPAFACDLPWLPTGFTVRQVVERQFAEFAPKAVPLDSADDLARLVFNGGESANTNYPHRMWDD